MERLILTTMLVISGVSSDEILKHQCALRGTSVVLKCKYNNIPGLSVLSINWYKIQKVADKLKYFLLSELPSPTNHVEYMFDHQNGCSLRINDVQFGDEGEYAVGFVTTHKEIKGHVHTFLSVKELTAVVHPHQVDEGDTVRLTCVSGCPEQADIMWMREGLPVNTTVFQATKKDAGRYYCAVYQQDSARSASVALTVLYAPTGVFLSVSPAGTVNAGSTVTFTCSSDANPSVTQTGYSLFKDGKLVHSGQNFIISDIHPSQTGQYHCIAWNGIRWRGSSLVKSLGIHLEVQYPPMNITVSVNPERAVEGSSINLTCSCEANTAADTYTWYRRTLSDSSSTPVQVGSGKMLSLVFMMELHSGLYFCNVRTSFGENNSTEVLLAMPESPHDRNLLPILAGTGVCLSAVVLLMGLLLFRKTRKSTLSQKTAVDLRPGVRKSNSDPNAVYANITMLPLSPLLQLLRGIHIKMLLHRTRMKFLTPH
ncbi:B-cell receptor CD22 [Oryzias latipes]|uniref:Ig-like domain-containing protein n=1 Tax=Oryzias latipes TaxID=8090 RepID=A0A3B3H3U7_ORYLA|nr:B-cell receptor CD22 [Oryzias latipes]